MKIDITNDLFAQREQLIDELIEFNNREGNRICSLVGEWGSGKSFFIDKFIERVKQEEVIETGEEESVPIEKQSFDILKFDAWENQASTNINGIFLEFVYNELIKTSKDEKSFYEFLQKYGFKYFKDIMKSAGEALLPLPKEVSKQIIKTVDEFNSMAVYKMLSNTILNEIIDEKKFYQIMIDLLFLDEQNNRYLLIIDELDRCEPRFSIELIKKVIYLNKEIIKKGKEVNFLIAINKVQFANLLKGYYGNEYDTHQYFDKVFDYEFDLPKAKKASDFIGGLLIKQKNGAIFEAELEERLSLISMEKFRGLNYRKLNILAEIIQSTRKIKDEKYSEYFTTGYYYDLLRFVLEVVKLSDYKEYIGIINAIDRLKTSRIYLVNPNKGIISINSKIENKKTFFDDVETISKYFKYEEMTVNGNGNLEEQEIETLKNLLSVEVLCLMSIYVF